MERWHIRLGTMIHVVSIYADDTLVYLRHPGTAVPELLRELTIFVEFSGLCLNSGKSKLFPMGSLRDTVERELPMVGLSWVADTVHYLGVRLAHTSED